VPKPGRNYMLIQIWFFRKTEQIPEIRLPNAFD